MRVQVSAGEPTQRAIPPQAGQARCCERRRRVLLGALKVLTSKRARSGVPAKRIHEDVVCGEVSSRFVTETERPYGSSNLPGWQI